MAGYELTDPLETERLLLRPYTGGDFEALLEMRSNPEVTRYLYWDPQTEDEVRQTLEKKIASSSIRSEGDVLALAAEHRSTGELVADVILHWVSREHGPGGPFRRERVREERMAERARLRDPRPRMAIEPLTPSAGRGFGRLRVRECPPSRAPVTSGRHRFPAFRSSRSSTCWPDHERLSSRLLDERQRRRS